MARKPAAQTSPFKPVDEIAPILASEIESRELSPDAFFLLCDQWRSRATSLVYLYRLWPVIDRRRSGEATRYIDKSALDEESPMGPISLERIGKLHGDGRYMAKLSDSSRSRGKTEVAATKFELRNTGRDPVVNPEEVDPNARDNKDFLQGLKARGVVPIQNETKMDATAALTTLLTQVLERQQAPAPKGPDPISQLEALQRLNGSPLDQALRIAELMKPKEDSLTPLLLKYLLEQKTVVAPPVDLTMMEKLLEFGERWRGGGGGGGAHWGMLVSAIPQALSSVRDLAGMYLAARSGQPVPQQPTEEVAVAPMNPYMALVTKALSAFERGIPADEWVGALEVLEPDTAALLDGLTPALVMSQLDRLWPQLPHLAPRKEELEKWVTAALE